MNNLRSRIFDLLGTRTAYRLGRALYMHGRGDIPNAMNSNGECLVQSCLVNALHHGIRGDCDPFVIFDVGANVGEWTISLLKTIPPELRDAIKIVCFEPVPGTNDTLRRNIVTETTSVYIENLALSSKTGVADMSVSHESNSGTNSFHRLPYSRSNHLISVPLTTASSYCKSNGINHVHLLKCDTEGHDVDVLRGALPLLQDNRISVFQFEYNQRWIYSRNFLIDVFDLIEDLPYTIAKLQPDHLLVYPSWHHELEKFFEGNYVIIHELSMNWFPLRYAGFDLSNMPTKVLKGIP